MFDFEKLDVYQHVRQQNVKVLQLLTQNKGWDPYLSDQWKRASISITVNLAEGVGRMSNADKKHFITISRGSVYECTSLLQMALDLGYIESDIYSELYEGYEKASKMLLGMYRSYTKETTLA